MGIYRLFKPKLSFRFGFWSDHSRKGHAVIFNVRQQLTVSPGHFLSLTDLR